MILIILAIVLIYWRSIRGEFLFDDPAILDMDFERWRLAYQGKDRPEDPKNFSKAFYYTLLGETRSLTHMGYFWTWRLAGFDPTAWHAVNVVFHIANTGLLYLLAFSIRPAAAPIAALLFAVHPHQVSAVSYISGRASLQTTFFALSAIVLAESLFVSWWCLPAAYLACLFAQLSKEDGFLWVLIFGFSYAALRVCFGTI